MYALLILSVGSLAGIVLILFKYTAHARTSMSVEPILLADLVHPKVKERVLPHIKNAHAFAVSGTLKAKKHLYYYLWVVSRRLVPFIERVSHKLETRLVSVINTIRGKGNVPT